MTRDSMTNDYTLAVEVDLRVQFLTGGESADGERLARGYYVVVNEGEEDDAPGIFLLRVAERTTVRGLLACVALLEPHARSLAALYLAGKRQAIRRELDDLMDRAAARGDLTAI